MKKISTSQWSRIERANNIYENLSKDVSGMVRTKIDKNNKMRESRGSTFSASRNPADDSNISVYEAALSG